MSDQCECCAKRGDLVECSATDCDVHENWYSQDLLGKRDRAMKREERLEKLLREAKGTIEQLRAVQNGCPLPSYEEAFGLANAEADRLVLAIDAELGRETCPPGE